MHSPCSAATRSRVTSGFSTRSGRSGYRFPTLLEATRKELPDTDVAYAPGCDVDGDGHGRLRGRGQRRLAAADVCVVALGDRAGLFGRGTSGEGCDAETLELPGVQGQLLDAIIATGRPVVLVMVSGRPYALGAYADRLAAVVQSFFPGEEGGAALAGVLSGRVCPSGRLPVSHPAQPRPVGHVSDTHPRSAQRRQHGRPDAALGFRSWAFVHHLSVGGRHGRRRGSDRHGSRRVHNGRRGAGRRSPSRISDAEQAPTSSSFTCMIRLPRSLGPTSA